LTNVYTYVILGSEAKGDPNMTLIEIAQMTIPQARKYLESIRWPNGPVCPHCGGVRQWKIRTKSARPGVYKCRECRKQYSVTVGTVMHSSKLSLRKWIMAFHLMCSSKKGVSALQLQRNLGLRSYKTAWHLSHRIRLAMKDFPVHMPPLQGTVEVDETYIGGRMRNQGRGLKLSNKTAVLALVERKGRAYAKPVKRVDAKALKGTILGMVDENSTIMTDEWSAYHGIGGFFDGGHGVVCHSDGEYVRGVVSTNQVESFFALLKRGVHGIFHHVSKEHLFRYCDEFSFRWSYRKVDDTERTRQAIKGADRKRLMYERMVNSDIERS